MSTLKVSSINNASASSGGLSIDSSGDVTVSSLDVTSGISGALPTPNRNLLYNGAMQVAQRGTSTASITSSGYYTADRWQTILTSLGTWTQSVENDAPAGSGLRKSLKMLCTTADAAPAASDVMTVRQSLEGQDIQRIAKGTASAQQLTLSFWVKSNVTGTFIARLEDTDNNRSVAASYTISASATWEKKSVTFPADTTGSLDNDNNQSLLVDFFLGAGSTYTTGTLSTSWTANASAVLAVGQTNLAAATNNYWQVTGVQLEVGDAATDFEFKSYGQELAECQRYYWQFVSDAADFQHSAISGATSTMSFANTPTPVSMRAIPTSVISTGTAGNYGRIVAYDTSYNLSVATVSDIAVVSTGPNTSSISLQLTHGSLSGSYVYRSFDTAGSTSVKIGLSAEL